VFGAVTLVGAGFGDRDAGCFLVDDAAVACQNYCAGPRRINSTSSKVPLWWAVVRDAGGDVAGLAMRTARTPPHPLFVPSMPDAAAFALADAVPPTTTPPASARSTLRFADTESSAA
jgi:hypothetical protein